MRDGDVLTLLQIGERIARALEVQNTLHEQQIGLQQHALLMHERAVELADRRLALDVALLRHQNQLDVEFKEPSGD